MKRLFKAGIAILLQWEAQLVLAKYKPKIIAVTGSVGKTSTKDAIYAALESSHFVRKSDKTFNTEIGVPLTILGVPNAWSNPVLWVWNLIEGLALILFPNQYPKWLVLEVGADRPGDIKRIASWLHADIVVVTRLPDIPVHVEFFKSPEEVYAEKAHLVKGAKPGAITILNADDERVLSMRGDAKGLVRTYGFLEPADIAASHAKVLYREKEGRRFPEGMTFRADYAGSSVPVSVYGSVGMQGAYAALAALATAVSTDVNLVAAGEGLAKYTPPPGRMRLIAGLKGSLIIDDSYNASPVASEEAIKLLGTLEGAGRKIAMLGDMLELGKYSAEEHKELGKRAAGAVDLLLTVGFRARFIAEGALAAGFPESRILQYEDSKKAGKELEGLLQEGDVVLIKGSQSMRMERAVLEIMAQPEERENLLVRQEREWRERA